MKQSLSAVALLLSSSLAIAQPVTQYGLGFTVPTTSNHVTLDSPQQGELVLDTGSSPGFYGYDGASWQLLAGDGSNAVGKTANIGMAAATVSVTNDSIKITGATASLSSTNPAYVRVPNTSGGSSLFKVTSDVVLTSTGASWGRSGRGNVSGAILRVVALNDGGTLRWGLIYQGGRTVLKSTNAFTSAASVVEPEDSLVNSALSGNAGLLEVGWVRADFTDATARWITQTAADALNVGVSADGVWQPFGVSGSVTGCTANPSIQRLEWTSVGETAQVRAFFSCTSNATTLSMTLPVKTISIYDWSIVPVSDNGVDQTLPGLAFPQSAGGRAMSFNKTVTSAFTASGTKAIDGGVISFHMYQP